VTTASRSSSVYLVFFCSGATALVYQVLWSRWLSLVFGSTTASMAVVLGAFMAGLALGSHIIGRRLDKTRRPLRAYAAVELGIGVFALLFPLSSGLVETLFQALISPGSPAAYALTVRAVLSFALLLVPTMCMGATLPLLTEFFRRHPRASRGWKVGVLYAANTFGAAAGIFLSTAFLIELLGLRATTLLAALLNFGIATVGWRLSREEVEQAPSPVTQAATTEAPPSLTREGQLAIAVLTVSGALALASEVLWTRTLSTFLGTSAYAFSSIVFVYLVGIAVGSAAMSRVMGRLKDHALVLLALLTFMGAYVLCAIFLFELLLAVDVDRMRYVSLLQVFSLYLRVGLLLVPLSIASGACFPLATRIIDPNGTEAAGALVARAYAWNTWGAVGGSLLAGFAVAPLLDYFAALELMALLYVASAVAGVAFLVVTAKERGASRIVLAAASVLVGAGVLVWIQAQPSYADRVRAHNLEVVSHKPGLQALTTVLRTPGEKMARYLLVNGQGMTVKVNDTKSMAHLPLLMHPDAKDTLVICFGMGTTYRAALSHGGNVTVVELVGGVLDAFPYFWPDAAQIQQHPKGRMIVDDGRNFLATTDERFDVITVDPPPPIDGAGVNHLYSREFVELMRDHLKPGGLAAHWIPFPNTLSGVDDQRSFDMLVDTFAGVFPHVYTIPGVHGIGLHMVGSMAPVDVTPALLEQRAQQPAVAADMVELEPYPPGYWRGIQHVEAPATDELIVTDDQPLLEFWLVRTALGGDKKVLPYHFW
jgi:spermidine synthase